MKVPGFITDALTALNNSTALKSLEKDFREFLDLINIFKKNVEVDPKVLEDIKDLKEIYIDIKNSKKIQMNFEPNFSTINEIVSRSTNKTVLNLAKQTLEFAKQSGILSHDNAHESKLDDQFVNLKISETEKVVSLNYLKALYKSSKQIVEISNVDVSVIELGYNILLKAIKEKNKYPDNKIFDNLYKEILRKLQSGTILWYYIRDKLIEDQQKLKTKNKDHESTQDSIVTQPLKSNSEETILPSSSPTAKAKHPNDLAFKTTSISESELLNGLFEGDEELAKAYYYGEKPTDTTEHTLDDSAQRIVANLGQLTESE